MTSYTRSSLRRGHECDHHQDKDDDDCHKKEPTCHDPKCDCQKEKKCDCQKKCDCHEEKKCKCETKKKKCECKMRPKPKPKPIPPPRPRCPPITDQRAREVQTIWQQAFPDATLLIPPSVGAGVGLVTHTMGDGRLLRINGLVSRSPLANNALYSFECAEGIDCSSHLLNLYEIMIPDIPGCPGEESTSEFYVRRLWELGLHVAGVHFHWWGSTVFQNDHLVAAVHHQQADMEPEEFSRRTIQALKEVMALLEKRAIPYPDICCDHH